MNIDRATERIESTLEKMQTTLGEVVFDEWFLVKWSQDGWEVLHYSGPRAFTYQEEFKTDMAALRETLAAGMPPGDFAFSHEGYGSGFDAHICAGDQLFALFNNTRKSTGEITQNPKWTAAQVYFMQLSEAFMVDPLAL